MIRLGLATVAATVLAASAGGASSVYVGFRTPSGNIGCGYWKFAGERAGLRCDIGSGLRPAPSRPRGCDGAWDIAVSMAPTGRAGTRCVGDTVREQRNPVLGYGKTWSRGGFACVSRPEGLTCRNLDGHGWFLSRERSRLF